MPSLPVGARSRSPVAACADAVWSSVGAAPNKSVILEILQPSLHWPPSPSLMEKRCVTQDVVDVLDRRVRYGMVLVKCVRAADPAHRHSRSGRGLREIGVLTPVAA